MVWKAANEPSTCGAFEGWCQEEHEGRGRRVGGEMDMVLCWREKRKRKGGGSNPGKFWVWDSDNRVFGCGCGVDDLRTGSYFAYAYVFDLYVLALCIVMIKTYI
jgi:hypothetical protein